MKVYLSGAIENAPDEGKKWREEMSRWLLGSLNHEVFNPLDVDATLIDPEEQQNFRSWKMTDYERFLKVVRRFIDRDLDVLCSDIDYLICYWDRAVRKGAGTHGEVTIAYHRDIPVYLVLGMPLSQVSSWILGCSTKVFGDFDELKKYLKQTYG
ncbi:MAG: hypothetical protein ACE5EE_06215 [Fidelibacterota bacterium]